MKIAVCLHGLARGSSVQADGAFLENYGTLLKKVSGADIFIHSWDEDIKDHLIEIFQGKILENMLKKFLIILEMENLKKI